jgi:hypothetical protein
VAPGTLTDSRQCSRLDGAVPWLNIGSFSGSVIRNSLRQPEGLLSDWQIINVLVLPPALRQIRINEADGPPKGLADPEKYAEVVFFMAYDGATFMTEATVDNNGSAITRCSWSGFSRAQQG